MEELSKHQLILLALLISFVTSLATGIVTVSLMNQSPQAIRTVNQIIEKTVREVASEDSVIAAAANSFEDKSASAVDIAMKSIVVLQNPVTHVAGGLGIVMSRAGVIIADKSVTSALGTYEGIFPDGTHVPLALVQSQNAGDSAFLAPTIAVSSTTAVPAAIGSHARLGQTVLSLSGTSTPMLGQGIITKLDIDHINPNGSQPAYIETSIASSKVVLGSPVFNLEGEIIGMYTQTLSGSSLAAFYPVAPLKAAVPVLR